MRLVMTEKAQDLISELKKAREDCCELNPLSTSQLNSR